MEQLNTVIQINEIKYQKNNFISSSNGYLDIKYFGNQLNQKNEINLNIKIIKEIQAFNIYLELKFTYLNECSRCLSKNNIEDHAEFNKSFSFSSNNDYELDFNNESIDLLPIISEIIISKMEFNNLCKKDCKGLCYMCGKDQNEYICSHTEKNIKQNPFSSLSELDL